MYTGKKDTTARSRLQTRSGTKKRNTVYGRKYKPCYESARKNKEEEFLEKENEYEIKILTAQKLRYRLKENEEIKLVEAIKKEKLDEARILLSKGVNYSCEDCHYFGFQKTCLLTTSMTKGLGLDTIEILSEFSSSDAILLSFSRYMNDVKHQIHEEAIDIFEQINESISQKEDARKHFVDGKLRLKSCKITDTNKDFMFFLMENGHFDLDKFIEKNLIESLFGLSRFSHTVVDGINKAVGLGADTSYKMKFPSMYCKTWTVVPGIKYIPAGTEARWAKVFVGVSLDDILAYRGFLSFQFTNDLVARALDEIASYTKLYNRRSRFISKRVRGFEESHEASEFDKQFVGMEIGLFAKVVSYLV